MQLVIEDAELVESVVLGTGLLSDDQFAEYFDRYEGFRVELSSRGELFIMPPTAPESGYKNSRISRQLDFWAEFDRRGISFDSSTYFYLSNGARVSPDASWLFRDRIPADIGSKPWHLCPDFVIELRSESDRMPRLQAKMLEWIEGGGLLAWLIDPKKKSVTVYRPGQEPETLTGMTQIAGEDPVAGFELDLTLAFSALSR